MYPVPKFECIFHDQIAVLFSFVKSNYCKMIMVQMVKKLTLEMVKEV